MPGWCRQLDVVVDHVSVEDDLEKAGIGRLLAVGIKARRLEADVERLPLARFFAGVDAGRYALVELVIFRLQLGARIDPAAIAALRLLDAPAIANLNFVQAL